MMYQVNISIDQATRDLLKQQNYSLFVFKGVNAGVGSVSTVWLTITGSELYDPANISIDWSESFYIGETSVDLQPGVRIIGNNPYTGAGSTPATVSIDNLYTYQGTGWSPNPKPGVNPQTFAIENLSQQSQNFYVSQESSSHYIIVLSVPGNGGIATLEPMQKIAMILSKQPYSTGSLIVQAFSPGLIARLTGANPTLSVNYNENTGWTGPTGQVKAIAVGDVLYDSLVNALP